MDGSTVTLKEVESVKDEGNRAFTAGNFYKAIMLYEEGHRRAQAFGKNRQLAFKSEFGDHSENPVVEEDPTQGHGIFY